MSARLTLLVTLRFIVIDQVYPKAYVSDGRDLPGLVPIDLHSTSRAVVLPQIPNRYF